MNIDEIIKIINSRFPEAERIIIGVDGRSASGKTSLASFLAEKLRANLFHSDDFFLRPFQRAPEAGADGNIDYESLEEVLKNIDAGIPFKYEKYSCERDEFCLPHEVSPRRFNIVEGAYSLHPRLISYYDYKIFLDISDKLQKERISARETYKKDLFFNLWIPGENAYFEKYKIKDKCDIIIRA